MPKTKKPPAPRAKLGTYVVPFGAVLIIRAASPENAAARVSKLLDSIDWQATFECECDCVEVSKPDVYAE